jgi:hypothetical protein
VSENQSDGEDTDAVEECSEETDEDYEEDEDDHEMLDYERNEEDDEMEDNEDAGGEEEEEDGEEDEWLESSDGDMVDDIRSNRDVEENQDIEPKEEDAKVIKFEQDEANNDELAERVVAMSSQHPLGDGDDNTFDGLDWAVIEIRNPFHHGMNGVLLDKDARKWLYFKRFKKSAPRNAILVATRHGIVRGIGTGSASSIKLRGSSHFRNIWSIRPEEALGMLLRLCFLLGLLGKSLGCALSMVVSVIQKLDISVDYYACVSLILEVVETLATFIILACLMRVLPLTR